MDIKVDINPEEVNRQVSAAIINSALGQTLKDEIEKKVSEMFKAGWNEKSIVSKVVEIQIERAIQEELKADEIRARIQIAVKAVLEEKLTDGFITQAISTLWGRISDKLYER